MCTCTKSADNPGFVPTRTHVGSQHTNASTGSIAAVTPSFLPFGADLKQVCNQAYSSIISSYTVYGSSLRSWIR